jgi:hypothetical protein
MTAKNEQCFRTIVFMTATKYQLRYMNLEDLNRHKCLSYQYHTTNKITICIQSVLTIKPLNICEIKATNQMHACMTDLLCCVQQRKQTGL